MGTKFRTMLAPIGRSTGDGRRFGQEAISLAAVPFPFEWAREREGGHDGAVAVGAVQEAAVLTVGQAIEQGYLSAERAEGMDLGMFAVWGRGELFDDIDRERMPRLAQDVAEVMHLQQQGTLGPSVDLDSFEGVPVAPGTDVPFTEAMYEAHWAEFGEEPKLELLITAGRVRAATLVSIPAFQETSRPFELLPVEDGQAVAPTDLGLVASMGALVTAELPPVAAFDMPALTGPTPITYDFETGRVFGHIATWRTCHVGYADVCVVAPKDTSGGYRSFNRYPVETADGTVWTGRLTVGGRHAGLSLAADAAVTEYDTKAVAAHVRAYEDEFGIVVAGIIEPGLTEGDRAILSRRKVSGDWRETADGLSLVEVLALSPGPRAHSEPGFPVETFSRAGRQVALVASLGPDPDRAPVAQVDVVGAVRLELARRDAQAALFVSISDYDQRVRTVARQALASQLTGV